MSFLLNDDDAVVNTAHNTLQLGVRIVLRLLLLHERLLLGPFHRLCRVNKPRLDENVAAVGIEDLHVVEDFGADAAMQVDCLLIVLSDATAIASPEDLTVHRFLVERACSVVRILNILGIDGGPASKTLLDLTLSERHEFEKRDFSILVEVLDFDLEELLKLIFGIKFIMHRLESA